MFAVKSRNGTKKCVGPSLFGGRIKKCTRNLSCLISPPSAIDCSLSASQDDSTHHKLQVGWEGVPELRGWVRICVSVYVWGPVGKYLFMLFFVWLLPPFIALQRHRRSVCVFWVVLLCICVSDLSGSQDWRVFIYLFILRGDVVSLNTKYTKKSLFGSSSLSRFSLPLSRASLLLVSVNICSVWLYLPDLDGELFQHRLRN